jgi:hypothetical protein
MTLKLKITINYNNVIILQDALIPIELAKKKGKMVLLLCPILQYCSRTCYAYSNSESCSLSDLSTLILCLRADDIHMVLNPILTSISFHLLNEGCRRYLANGHPKTKEYPPNHDIAVTSWTLRKRPT